MDNNPGRRIDSTKVVTAFGIPYQIIWSLFLPSPYAQGLKLLSSATATALDPGISWSGRSECAPNDKECVITINEIYIWLIAMFFLWMVLSIYLDNIMLDVNGVRKPLFYFIWIGNGGNKVKGSTLPPESATPDDEDVLEEVNMVRQGLIDTNVAVQTRGLANTYPGRTRTFYHAVKVIT